METKNNRTWTLSADNVIVGACYWLKKNSIECKFKGTATIVDGIDTTITTDTTDKEINILQNPIKQKFHLFIRMKPVFAVLHHSKRCVTTFRKRGNCLKRSQIVVFSVQDVCRRFP